VGNRVRYRFSIGRGAFHASYRQGVEVEGVAGSKPAWDASKFLLTRCRKSLGRAAAHTRWLSRVWKRLVEATPRGRFDRFAAWTILSDRFALLAEGGLGCLKLLLTRCRKSLGHALHVAQPGPWATAPPGPASSPCQLDLSSPPVQPFRYACGNRGPGVRTPLVTTMLPTTVKVPPSPTRRSRVEELAQQHSW